MAAGISQNLDAQKRFQSLTYAGFARISSLDSFDPVAKQQIFVLNEEFYHQLSPLWQYSLALSYRRQNEYETHTPFAAKDPSIKQEFRGYARYSFMLPLAGGSLKWATTARQEFRRFSSPDFNDLEEIYQLRSRFKSQVVWRLDSAGIHQLTFAAEMLFSMSRLDSGRWSSFDYRESRFGLYYSLFPKTAWVSYTVGYMNDLLGSGPTKVDGHYISFDIVFLNPFGEPALR